MKLKLEELRGSADDLLGRGEALAAVRIYVALLRRVPRDYRARLSLADALARANAKEAAETVYEAAAKLCIDGGMPLVALVAIRALETLHQPPGAARPQPTARSEALMERLAVTYARDSERIGQVGARMNVLYPEGGAVDSRELRAEMTVEELVARAAEVGGDLSSVGEMPPRFPPVPVLSRLSQQRMLAVMRAMWVQRLPVGHVLMERGESGRSCYLIALGRLRVTAPDDTGNERELAQLGPGALVGEMALITGSPRLATVTVIEPTDVVQLASEALAAIGDELDQLAPALDQVAQNRYLKNMLEQNPLFRVFGPEQRQQLLRRCSAFDVPEGTQLFAQGETAKGIYLLLRGEAQVTRARGEGAPSFDQRLPAGTMVGVNATLYEQAAAATARIVSPATVLFLSSRAVHRLIEAIPEFKAQLEDVALHRDKLIHEADQAASG